MKLVVDASAWAAIVTPEATSAAARRTLGGMELCAPELLLAEIASLLWQKVRRSEVAPEDADAALALTRQAITWLEAREDSGRSGACARPPP
ncbi:type II toxin-antitoxin system VapC family toxin [Paracraurococcus ruber]|uniref:PIN domain-containing protein n=1 Tax=Paracraurococcus ruber TaxID=77675 RepID=A0ABS1CTV9_9PROT|nr:type II toxin-antitoxin system VapC family toxin [Paracraurococcus ruber]MBK1657835.1 hypothetical protein [Paracraurococcus ruber]TDG31387.1 hypothetical protein E2C05_11075 [Paracraurococcus ruber]